MNTQKNTTTFNRTVTEALKKMQKTISNPTTYKTTCSNGLIIIKRTNNNL